MKKASDLSWTLKDWQDSGYEIPDSVLASPDRTEGELMSDAEITQWLEDNIKTLTVNCDRNKELFRRLHEGLIQDLSYLVEIGRMDADTLIWAKDENNFNG